ncbi:hypothetical protein M885DRAFT_183957 [Pelagophyceae sp. CCMP2097]|nr:hypothetical protein M885DRAFT_183957 [Pelagophyceae sp. CCMP2097]
MVSSSEMMVSWAVRRGAGGPLRDLFGPFQPSETFKGGPRDESRDGRQRRFSTALPKRFDGPQRRPVEHDLERPLETVLKTVLETTSRERPLENGPSRTAPRERPLENGPSRTALKTGLETVLAAVSRRPRDGREVVLSSYGPRRPSASSSRLLSGPLWRLL